MKQWLKQWMVLLLAVLCLTTSGVAQQSPPSRMAPPPGEIVEIVAFGAHGLLGDHIHIFGNTSDLGKWGNNISSMVIISGRWEFFDSKDFQGTRMGEFGPGTYLNVKDYGLKDKGISSIRLVSPASAR